MQIVELVGRVELAIGMQVMVTFNVETDLNIVHGSCGEITKVILDDCEPAFSHTAVIVKLTYPLPYLLIKLNHTKSVQLDGLEKNIILLIPMEHTSTIIHGNQPKSIKR
jgi:hypothetical protein